MAARKFIRTTCVSVLATLGIVVAVIGYWSIKKNSATTLPTEEDFVVVTTIFPYYSLAKQIVGDAGVVENLLPTGAGAHDVALTPHALQLLERADVLVINGLGLESYLDIEKIQADHPDLVVVQLSDTLVGEVITGSGVNNSESTTTTPNPHIWLSPKEARVQALTMMKFFSQLNPTHAATYTNNGEHVTAELGQLDADYRAAVSGFHTTEFIAFHNALPYVARDYGLTQVAVIEEFPGETPSPQEIIELQQLMTNTGVHVILTEPQFSPRTAESLAQDTGARVVEFDTIETGDPNIDTYQSKMRQNLHNLQLAMNL